MKESTKLIIKALVGFALFNFFAYKAAVLLNPFLGFFVVGSWAMFFNSLSGYFKAYEKEQEQQNKEQNKEQNNDKTE